MKGSARSRRMQRNHRRLKQQAKLSLVSLMDIFTILVFFLMMNSGDVEVLEADKAITLPDSSSELKPTLQLTIKLDASEIRLGGETVAQVDESLAHPGDTIEGLFQQLQVHAQLLDEQNIENGEAPRRITIMGDKDTPYRLLKKVMQTCVAANYRDVSLAVNQVSSNSDDELQVAGVSP